MANWEVRHAVPLREDCDTSGLHALAKRPKDGAQSRRLLAFAAIYDGATRTQAARLGDVTVQIVRVGGEVQYAWR